MTFEDLLYFQGEDISTQTFEQKTRKMVEILQSNVTANSWITFCLPAIHGPPTTPLNVDVFFQADLGYKIYSVHCRDFHKKDAFVCVNEVFHKARGEPLPIFMEQREKEKEKERWRGGERDRDRDRENRVKKGNKEDKHKPIASPVKPPPPPPPPPPVRKPLAPGEQLFQLQADADQQDIYYVWNAKGTQVGVAAIPDYKTSLMMSHLFRGSPLDDDDDDEDEDVQMDVEKKVSMVCTLHPRFQRWMPLRVYQ
jgi:hypothetical protein